MIIDQVGFYAGGHNAPRLAARLALWTGRPAEALEEVLQVLPSLTSHTYTYRCGDVLAAGMRACADLADHARARQDEAGVAAALAAADDLVAWLDHVEGVPFADHAAMARIPAERATWDAERFRVAGRSDPTAWAAAAKAWDSLGWPHNAGYARWRQVQAQLDAGQPATAALRAAATAARGHAPLTAQIQALADRARIPLQAPPPSPGARPVSLPAPYGLTPRELTVLRLLAVGRTNAQIGAELYISPKTASVHVTSILRKLGVSGRVQAAALAERAGLLSEHHPNVP
jgi:DNA-binding CsgD family transcriptional regulator